MYFNVIDLNDNQPVFDSSSYSTELLENVTIGTSVLTVSAQDLDSGTYTGVNFSIFNYYYRKLDASTGTKSLRFFDEKACCLSRSVSKSVSDHTGEEWVIHTYLK